MRIWPLMVCGLLALTVGVVGCGPSSSGPGGTGGTGPGSSKPDAGKPGDAAGLKKDLAGGTWKTSDGKTWYKFHDNNKFEHKRADQPEITGTWEANDAKHVSLTF